MTGVSGTQLSGRKSYRHLTGNDGKYHLEIEDPPSNLLALRMAPAKREPYLDHGVWLIMNEAVWSVADRKSIPKAVELARKFPEISVGIRPFERFEELGTWLPEAEELGQRSPQWTVLRDGQVRGQQLGIQSIDDLVELVETSLELRGISKTSEHGIDPRHLPGL